GTIELPPRWIPTEEQRAGAEALLKRVGLEDRLDARWPTLSQGERGRALIARALVPAPRLLLLDEPTTGLDVAAREQLLETVDDLARSREELASVLVTHHLEELPESTSHALLISNGRVVASGPVEQAITSDTISAAFGHPIRVQHADGRWNARAVRNR
ncbi:MAG TPA: ATP-binding cassette domain-containing protein, partial [Microlunatus sp.]|nr:ATP-binding cassette domain-containing protein [Microlunatus sp.]